MTKTRDELLKLDDNALLVIAIGELTKSIKSLSERVDAIETFLMEVFGMDEITQDKPN